MTSIDESSRHFSALNISHTLWWMIHFDSFVLLKRLYANMKAIFVVLVNRLALDSKFITLPTIVEIHILSMN